MANVSKVAKEKVDEQTLEEMQAEIFARVCADVTVLADIGYPADVAHTVDQWGTLIPCINALNDTVRGYYAKAKKRAKGDEQQTVAVWLVYKGVLNSSAHEPTAMASAVAVGKTLSLNEQTVHDIISRARALEEEAQRIAEATTPRKTARVQKAFDVYIDGTMAKGRPRSNTEIARCITRDGRVEIGTTADAAKAHGIDVGKLDVGDELTVDVRGFEIIIERTA